jgi:predicted lactoylglutathione lyase
METVFTPSLSQLNLVVRDVAASAAFYRCLGLAVQEAGRPEWAKHHASVTMPNGTRLELDSAPFARQWGAERALAGPSAMVLFLSVPSREDVDRLHASASKAGYRSQRAPSDAFWGARYAILEDPDGNSVGLMSPMEGTRRFAPPAPPA